MTAITPAAQLPPSSLLRSKAAWAVTDSIAIAKRNIVSMTRRPQLLAFVTIQPILFLLIFRYVFGGSIHVGRVSYVNFLMAGIFVQTMMMGTQNTAIGMAEDLHTGLIERFRSLVMARSAVLGGRVIADTIRNVFVIGLMLGVGYIIGFRLETNGLDLMAAVGLLLLFGFAIAWVTAFLGLISKSAEAAGAAALPLAVLLGFPSSAFVSTQEMPSAVRAYAEHQPLTATVNAVRPLLLGGATSSQAIAAVAWCLGIIAVFAPRAVRRYRRVA